MRVRFAVPAALLLAACASGPTVRRAVPPEGLAVDAVAVYPVRFTWDEPAYRGLELGHRQVDELLADGRAAVIGPEELRVGAWDDEPIRGSDVGNLVLGIPADLKRFLVLRTTVDQRVARSSTAIVDARGKLVGRAGTEERTLVAKLEVIHPGSRKRLFVLEAEQAVDPFAEDRPDHDPLPEATELVSSLAREALALVDGLDALPERRTAAPFAYARSPLGAFGAAPDALAAEAARLDPLAADVLRDGRVRFAAPAAGDAVVRRLLAARRGGLYVLEPDEGGALARGDLIVAVDGVPLGGPQLLHRRLRKVPAGGRLPLRVERDGRERDVLVTAR